MNLPNSDTGLKAVSSHFGVIGSDETGHESQSSIAGERGAFKGRSWWVTAQSKRREKPYCKLLAHVLSDADMADFIRMLEYNCAWYGTEFVKGGPLVSERQDLQRLRNREVRPAAVGADRARPHLRL